MESLARNSAARSKERNQQGYESHTCLRNIAAAKVFGSDSFGFRRHVKQIHEGDIKNEGYVSVEGIVSHYIPQERPDASLSKAISVIHRGFFVMDGGFRFYFLSDERYAEEVGNLDIERAMLRGASTSPICMVGRIIRVNNQSKEFKPEYYNIKPLIFKKGDIYSPSYDWVKSHKN